MTDSVVSSPIIETEFLESLKIPRDKDPWISNIRSEVKSFSRSLEEYAAPDFYFLRNIPCFAML